MVVCGAPDTFCADAHRTTPVPQLALMCVDLTQWPEGKSTAVDRPDMHIYCKHSAYRDNGTALFPQQQHAGHSKQLPKLHSQHVLIACTDLV